MYLSWSSQTFLGSMSQIYKNLEGTSICTMEKWLPVLYRKLNNRLTSHHVIEGKPTKCQHLCPYVQDRMKKHLCVEERKCSSSLNETAFLFVEILTFSIFLQILTFPGLFIAEGHFTVQQIQSPIEHAHTVSCLARRQAESLSSLNLYPSVCHQPQAHELT